MSQNNPKYKRLESLLSDAKQVEPEPQRTPEDHESDALKVQIPQQDAKPAAQDAEAIRLRWLSRM